MSDTDARLVLELVRAELLRLARREDDVAAAEAELVPYWAACPDTVLGHRYAATALREDAELLRAGSSVEQREQLGVEASPSETTSAIDWDRPTWGGGVRYAANGSWVPDRHDRSGRNPQ